ncbi:hypothetical protein [Streptomyces sp. NBC_01446]|uniref:hypothetical protein n=1 Tax=Streptomyces sp. NBC_01446 TaxID=2903870 RepID=UPI0022551D46|nr:hypothetical protein [Streptomyces sp. NBC_01446]MCX4649415.1 hypothetical protein [Streptomyces sp. NBC_01446]
MSTRYVLRLQADPADDVADVEERLLRLVKDSRADEICVFFFGMEFNDGHEPVAEVAAWLDRTRPWRTALRSAGVGVSLNPGHTLSHGDWGRKRRESWQPMVDQNGTEAEITVCPLDTAWQAYFAECLHQYAAEDVCAVWIEDDIRLHNHAPLDWGGCFCPLHLAEFASRTGEAPTRAELVAACTAPGEAHPWRRQWLDLLDDTTAGLLSEWRAIADAHGVELGLMSSRPESHAPEGRDWSRWLDKVGIHRPHFWPYSDTAGPELPLSAALLDAQRGLQPSSLVSYPEIECWPYGQWNKSFRQTGAQMALAHILGCHGLAVSLYDFLGNHPDDEPERARFLADWRPTLDWLADTFPTSLRTVGIGVPWSPETARELRVDDDGNSGRWQALQADHREWAGWLGAIGHAVTVRPESMDLRAAQTALPGGETTVRSLAGRSVWAYTDDQLRDWLHGGLILDGTAAEILHRRGFGDLIGVRGLRTPGVHDPIPAREICTDPEFTLRVGAAVSIDAEVNGHRPLAVADPVPGARIASRLVDPRGADVGAGLVLYSNALGGRTAVCPWPATARVRMTPQRAAQLSAVADWLGDGRHARVSGQPWLVPQALTDGRRWRLVVWNAGPDEVARLTVRLPNAMPAPTDAVQITARGERLPASYTDGTVELTRPMGQWEFVVLAADCEERSR